MVLSRRKFIERIGQLSVIAPAVGLPDLVTGSSNDPAALDSMGVLVDIPQCIGCRRCEYACQEAAGFPVPPLESLNAGSVPIELRRPSPDAYTVVNRFVNPADPDRPSYVKANCLHCLDPGCVSACLVAALTRSEDGAVVYDAGRCMGCRYCMVACPFQIPAYEYDNALTPQVRKCEMKCRERDASGVPACVRSCPANCPIYGRRSELLELAREKIRKNPAAYVDHIYGEHEAGGTSWLFLSSVPFEDIGFVQVGTDAAPRLTEAVQHGIFKFFLPPLVLYGLLGVIMAMTRPSAEGGESKEPPARN